MRITSRPSVQVQAVFFEVWLTRRLSCLLSTMLWTKRCRLKCENGTLFTFQTVRSHPTHPLRMLRTNSKFHSSDLETCCEWRSEQRSRITTGFSTRQDFPIQKPLKIQKTLIAWSSSNFITHRRNLNVASSRVHPMQNTKRNPKFSSRMESSIKHPLMVLESSAT